MISLALIGWLILSLRPLSDDLDAAFQRVEGIETALIAIGNALDADQGARFEPPEPPNIAAMLIPMIMSRIWPDAAGLIDSGAEILQTVQSVGAEHGAQTSQDHTPQTVGETTDQDSSSSGGAGLGERDDSTPLRDIAA